MRRLLATVYHPPTNCLGQRFHKTELTSILQEASKKEQKLKYTGRSLRMSRAPGLVVYELNAFMFYNTRTRRLRHNIAKQQQD